MARSGMTMRLDRWLHAMLLAAACTYTPQAWGADLALLVGVADYPALPRRLWLHGPINDVALMRNTLLKRGFEVSAIRTLVSRAGAGDEPTRANIVAAMQRLTIMATPGDRIVLYLAGHGSQQPQPQRRGNRPSEPDGLDEVFLPADVRQWDGRGGSAAIPNALTDDEIGEWIDGLVDRGATVWGIFDTCHAGGLARGRATRWRSVAAEERGLPRQPQDRRREAAGQPMRVDGRSLVFAARAHELTGEEWFTSEHGQRLHGVFTFHLAGVLSQGTALDLIGLEREVRARYRQERRVNPVPVFQGDGLRLWP